MRGAIICLCGQNPEFKRRGQRLIPYLALLREGLALPAQSLETAAGSYPAFSPLPDRSGGLFSAALSFPWNMVHGILIYRGLPALWSPDFPLRFRGATAADIPKLYNIHPDCRDVQSGKQKRFRQNAPGNRLRQSPVRKRRRQPYNPLPGKPQMYSPPPMHYGYSGIFFYCSVFCGKSRELRLKLSSKTCLRSVVFCVRLKLNRSAECSTLHTWDSRKL